MTAYNIYLRKEAKWEKRSMFQRHIGFDMKNTSDYMVLQKMPLMKSVFLELWHNPLFLQLGKSQ